MVPSGPTNGRDEWSRLHSFGQTPSASPLISIGADHVTPPSPDWLKMIGKTSRTPLGESSCSGPMRVQVTYTQSRFGLEALVSATTYGLSWKPTSSLLTTPIGKARYSWNPPCASGEWKYAPWMPGFDFAT